jgi:hypothetical protein
MPMGMQDESAVEKLERLLQSIEADKDTDTDDPIAKADAAVAKTLALIDTNQTADLTKISSRDIREFASSIGIEVGSPDAYEQLKKKATRRDVERFLATPVPPKTLGAGAALAFSKEKIEELAKANGYGMNESEWKR